MEQQQYRWDPESGMSGTAAAEVGPREWSEWNSIRGGTQRVEWNSRSRGGTREWSGSAEAEVGPRVWSATAPEVGHREWSVTAAVEV